MDKNDAKVMIGKIHKESENMDRKWLTLHLYTVLFLVGFSVLVEMILGYLIGQSEQLHTSINHYRMKYIFIPSLLNCTIGLIAYIIVKSEKLKNVIKIYLMSLLMILVCFILFTVHVIYPSMSFLFSLPILLTVVYADYRLTLGTTFLGIAIMLVSELFITWDPDKVSILVDSASFSNFAIAIIFLIGFSITCLAIIHFEQEKKVYLLNKEAERLHLESQLGIDELTTLYNRKELNQTILEMQKNRLEHEYILVMIDVDNFKFLNDNYGHMTGDRCLMKLGELLKKGRANKRAFRYGGDEFCLIFKDSLLEDVKLYCKNLQEDIGSMVLHEDMNIPLTLSIGISRYEGHDDIHHIFETTDQALYEAKRQKDCIYTYTSI